ncbi:MAG: molybdenum cofactor guanylyltransferase, partial [Gammaproteobacteria bacterium]|nr:molybdenum cofactor guanylyltransferase [Gammaproteobacteria bacterium]
MGGVDKGLVTIDGTPLIEQLLEQLLPHTSRIIINANRN